jgi:tight adherence protein B
MSSYVFAGIILFVVIVIIELLLYSWRAASDFKRSNQVLDRLQEDSWENEVSASAENILKKRIISSIPFLNRLLFKINFIERLELLIRQTDATYAPAVYILLALVLGLTGFLTGNFYFKNSGMGLLLGLVSCLSPFVWLCVKKNMRRKKFAMQLPDALDLIARSLQAGHSFSSGLKLVSDNFPAPVGSEFAETIREINFGLPVAEALQNLGRRVGSSDLNFFIIATILQRDTGGNLAEITQTIAALIRERFKFADKVRVLAAEGKISAFILIALPFVVLFFLMSGSPDYVGVLFNDPIGKKACIGAALLMLLGIVVITRMIKVEV